MNVFKDIQKYAGKKVRLCVPFSPVKKTTIHIISVTPSDIYPDDRRYDLIVYRFWANTYWKYEVINRSVLHLYNPVKKKS